MQRVLALSLAVIMGINLIPGCGVAAETVPAALIEQNYESEINDEEENERGKEEEKADASEPYLFNEIGSAENPIQQTEEIIENTSDTSEKFKNQEMEENRIPESVTENPLIGIMEAEEGDTTDLSGTLTQITEEETEVGGNEETEEPSDMAIDSEQHDPGLVESEEGQEEIEDEDTTLSKETDNESDENKEEIIENTGANPKADLENRAVWEKTFADIELTGIFPEDALAIALTQIGYKESRKNYVIDEKTGRHKGYTRYGAWYGSPYGDWCAMFCSFCLSYAGAVKAGYPYSGGCSGWTKSLKKMGMFYEPAEYSPKPGDLVFFKRSHVGFFVSMDEENENVLIVLDGNNGGDVGYSRFYLHQVSGYGYVPQTAEEMESLLNLGEVNSKADRSKNAVTLKVNERTMAESSVKESTGLKQEVSDRWFCETCLQYHRRKPLPKENDTNKENNRMEEIFDYKIKYELNGGTNVPANPDGYNRKSDAIVLAEPTKPGYRFVGWFSNKRLTKKVNEIKKGSKGSKTFYVKWEKLRYSVSYELNGGVNNKRNKNSFTIDGRKLYKPSRKGYMFIGWFSDETLTQKWDRIPGEIMEPVTVYAGWEKMK